MFSPPSHVRVGGQILHCVLRPCPVCVCVCVCVSVTVRGGGGGGEGCVRMRVCVYVSARFIVCEGGNYCLLPINPSAISPTKWVYTHIHTYAHPCVLTVRHLGKVRTRLHNCTFRECYPVRTLLTRLLLERWVCYIVRKEENMLK